MKNSPILLRYDIILYHFKEFINMKSIVLVIMVSLAFLSCASSGPARKEPVPPKDHPLSDNGNRAETPALPRPIDRAIDRVYEQVRADDQKIEKYFVTDEDGRIVVKADIQYSDEEFEIRYDLNDHEESGRPEKGGDLGLWVGFSLENKKTGERREDFFWWSIQEDAAGLLLAFDDDYRLSWEKNFAVLDRYGAKVTYFVQGELVAGDTAPGALAPFCAQALSRGHDIGYHTANHLNLPKMSEEVFFRETLSGVDKFRQAGIPLRAFAYPFGLSEPWMREALTAAFGIQRGFGVTYRVYTVEAIQEGYIASRSIDNILFKEEEAFDAMITAMFRTLKFIGGGRILPITTHDISDSADWGIKPRRLEFLLETAKALKLKFYRYGDLCRTP
jgi:peptidoglycan/xylan/chitin deacetylase (PgdA/CDA1 family)